GDGDGEEDGDGEDGDGDGEDGDGDGGDEQPSYDLEDLQKAVASYSDKNEFNYTRDSWNSYQVTVGEDRVILNDYENYTQEDINNDVVNINNAENALQAVADTGEISDEIVEFNSKDENKYTKDSWDAYANAISNGQAVVNDPRGYNQTQVDNVLNSIRDAKSSLVDLTELNKAIDAYDDRDDKDEYTDKTWDAYADAVDNARGLADRNNSGGKEEVDDALIAIQDAESKLDKVQEDTSALEDLLEKEGKYLEKSFKEEMEERLDGEVGEKEYEQMVQEVKDKASNGEEDVSSLEKEIKEKDSKDSDDYTEDTWESYESAVSDGEKVLDSWESSDSSNIDDVRDAVNKIKEAKEKLDEVADLGELESVVSDYNNKKDSESEDDYTDESWGNFVGALDKAQGILDSSKEYGQSEVDEAIENIKNAYNNLEEVTVDTNELENLLGTHEEMLLDSGEEDFVDSIKEKLKNKNVGENEIDDLINKINGKVDKIQKEKESK